MHTHARMRAYTRTCMLTVLDTKVFTPSLLGMMLSIGNVRANAVWTAAAADDAREPSATSSRQEKEVRGRLDWPASLAPRTRLAC